MRDVHPAISMRIGAVLLLVTLAFGFRWLTSDEVPSRVVGRTDRIEHIAPSAGTPPLVLLTIDGRCYGAEQFQAPDLFKYKGQEIQVETYNRPMGSTTDCLALSMIIAPDKIYTIALESAGINRGLAIVAMALTVAAFAAGLVGSRHRRCGGVAAPPKPV